MCAFWWAGGRAVWRSSADRAVGEAPNGSCSFSGLVWSAVEVACALRLEECMSVVTPLELAGMSDKLPGKLLEGWSGMCCRGSNPDAEVDWRWDFDSEVSAGSGKADMECAVWNDDCCADSVAKRLCRRLAACCGAAACFAVKLDGECGLAGAELDPAAVADGPEQAETVEPESKKACVRGVFACN